MENDQLGDRGLPRTSSGASRQSQNRAERDAPNQANAQGLVGEMRGKANRAAQGAKAKVSSAAGHQKALVKEKAKETAGSLELEARQTADRGIGRATERLKSVADALRSGSDAMSAEEPEMGSALQSAAERVDRVGQYLDERDAQAIISETQDYGRRNPAIFLGGALAAGIFVGRFLSSSARRRQNDQGGPSPEFERGGGI